MKSPSTWKDTVGCVAVLLAIVVSTVSGAYEAHVDSTPVAQAGVSSIA